MNPKKILIVVAAVSCAVFSAYGQSAGDPYVWRPYSPNISYDFKTAPGYVPVPTPTRNDAPSRCTVQGSRGSGWWVFHWGPAVNPLLSNGQNGAGNDRVVRNEIIDPMLERMNDEFTYFRETMGWPPDSRARKGLRSGIYLYGSGMGCVGGGRDSIAQGGWQSSDGADPVVLLSWRPVLAFHGPSYQRAGFNDASGQTGGVVHEGIHSVLASMLDGSGQATGRNVPGWFHEGGNTWLQKQADAQRNNRFGTWAMLDGTGFIAPFMPIECYSGWLQDGSFGGPNAEGVNRNNSSGQQICTWRAWLGGTQYGNGFPSFMGEWLGLGSIPWIWVNSTNSSDRVLGTIAKGLGEQQTRRLITEYRAKQAVLDLRRWTEGARAHISGNFGRNLGPEGNTAGGNWFPNLAAWWSTPYVTTTNDGTGVLTPDPLTLPGWSGANQIPLTIPANMTTVTIDFMPDTANMTIQLAYRDVNGRAVYSAPVAGTRGQTSQVSLRLDTRPRMGPGTGTGADRSVIIAVISNSDYRYLGDATRFAKYKYKIKIPEGVTAASTRTAWFNITSPAMVMSPEYQAGGNQAGGNTSAAHTASPSGVSGFKVTTDRAGILRVNYHLSSPGSANFDIYNTAGKLVKTVPTGRKASGSHNAEINLRSMGIPSGTYVVRLKDVPGMSKSVAFVK